MLGQVKKMMPPDFGARLGAWWDGREYDPAAESSDAVAAETDASEGQAGPDVPVMAAAAPTSAPNVAAAAANLRIQALETLWGEGRYSPSSDALDQKLLDALFECEDGDNDLGFLGVDAALMNTCKERSGRVIHAAEWRSGCAERSNQLVPGVSVMLGEVDRPKGLPEGGLGAVLSVDAFAYADHKAGLVARVFRALGPKGRWVAVDTVRHTRKAPAEPFASAFAEPMLAEPEEISDLLELAGFRSVTRVDLTADVLAAAAAGYARFASVMEEAVRKGAGGRDGALFLQELSWEARAWRSRMRALEGGALTIEMWIADKSPDAKPVTPKAAPAKPAAAPSALAKPAAAKSAPAPEPKPEPKPKPKPAAVVEPPPPEPAASTDDDLDWDLGGGEAMDQSAVDSLFD